MSRTLVLPEVRKGGDIYTDLKAWRSVLNGNVLPRTEQIISVFEYNVRGDGTTDDKANIQAALDRAERIGGTVVFPPGTYMISGVLTYASNVRLLGFGGATIKNLASRTVPLVMLQPESNGVEDVVIEGLTFDQNATVANYASYDGDSLCISVEQTVNALVKNCIFRNVMTMAVWCDSRTGYTENLTVTGCTVMESRGGGFSLFGQIRGVRFQGCTVYDTHDDAYAFQGISTGGTYYLIDQASVIDCKAINCNRRESGSAPHGCIITGVRNCTVNGLTVRRSAASGLLVSGADNTAGGTSTTDKSTAISILNVTIEEAGRIGDPWEANTAYAVGDQVHNGVNGYVCVTAGTSAGAGGPTGTGAGIADNTVVWDCNSVGPLGNGITLIDCEDVTIGGVVVTKSRQNGIMMQRVKRASVAPCAISQNYDAGFDISDSEDICGNVGTVLDNGSTAPSAQPYGILINGANSATRNIRLEGRVGNSNAGVTGYSTTYGAYLVTGSATPTDIRISGDFSGCATAASGGATGTRVTYDLDTGIVRENSGDAIITAGNTTKVVAHGLGGTPLLRNIWVTFKDNPSSWHWVNTIGGTNFTVNINAALGADCEFAWHAKLS